MRQAGLLLQSSCKDQAQHSTTAANSRCSGSRCCPGRGSGSRCSRRHCIARQDRAFRFCFPRQQQQQQHRACRTGRHGSRQTHPQGAATGGSRAYMFSLPVLPAPMFLAPVLPAPLRRSGGGGGQSQSHSQSHNPQDSPNTFICNKFLAAALVCTPVKARNNAAADETQNSHVLVTSVALALVQGAKVAVALVRRPGVALQRSGKQPGRGQAHAARPREFGGSSAAVRVQQSKHTSASNRHPAPQPPSATSTHIADVVVASVTVAHLHLPYHGHSRRR